MGLAERPFLFPDNIYFDEDTLTESYGRFIAEPLERGYGTTIGNSLRRILLSSIEGAAITSVSIEGVQHEFSTLKGVKEDVVEIILNLKQLRFNMYTDDDVTSTIEVNDKDEITAADILDEHGLVESLNPEEHIASIENGTAFKATLTISKGRGYMPSGEIDISELPFGTIAIDAIFTPIKKVFFRVEKTRVGKSTDYDKLILDLWTDGSITPRESINKATQILIDLMSLFTISEEIHEEQIELEQAPAPVDEQQTENPVEEPNNFNENLIKAVDELELSVRSHNCLKNANIKYIYELVQKSEHEMLRTKNFGRKSLNELKEILVTMGLDFYTKIDMDEIQRALARKKEEQNASQSSV